MPGIRLVTDGASDLRPDVLGDLPVTVVPLDVRLGSFGPEQTRAMTPEEFWHACDISSGLPETSAPSPGEFTQAFLEARDAGYDGAVCVTLSSELSATYQAAAPGPPRWRPGFPVEVVDSRSATMAEGLVVLEGADRAARRRDLDGGGGRAFEKRSARRS